jgi:uncharacterized protein (UPF0548 family)
MIRLRKPDAGKLRAFLDAHAGLGFTYPAVGATATAPPAGYSVDHVRTKLGEGERAFTAASAALERWAQFQLGWVEAWPLANSIEVGEAVVVVAHFFGLWWLNACRIVYVVDERGPVARFGFAYGTLPGHAESGEERFLVEWDHGDGSVWYDILAFSRPSHVLARLGGPLARRFQARFRRDSTAAMQRAVNEPSL